MQYADLIERSFSMLYNAPQRPNLSMLYNAELKSFSEGFIWNGWWIQNSYGFSMGVIPFLGGLWRDTLQKSYDGFWNRIGDGKRIGSDNGKLRNDHPVMNLCAPDGSLGDTATVDGIIYKQGDGDFNSYDWFYEATAAGVIIQCETLLFNRDPAALAKYIPLIRRSMRFIENTRDESGLFLVGMCCNLLAPSYGGGINKETGEIEKAYLTGLAVTYAGALKRFIEVLKLAGEDPSMYEEQLRQTEEALPKLLTPEGYYCRCLEKDGTMHGVYGAPVYGYFDASPNVDAIALGVADTARSRAIYTRLASIKGLRRYGPICCNFPHLDDTYLSYRGHSHAPDSFGYFSSGDWVDGGCWGTVEGRAILAYMQLGQYADAFRAADIYMQWAEEYRQDAPLSQWGANTCNPWAAESEPYRYENCRPVAVMVDNFAAATCLLRGLFGYTAAADSLTLTPRIPSEMGSYRQKYPVWFGNTALYIHYEAGDKPMKAWLGDKELPVCEDRVVIPAELLDGLETASVTITKNDGMPQTAVPYIPVLTGNIAGVPEDVANIYRKAKDLYDRTENAAEKDTMFHICHACETAAERRTLPYLEYGLRPMTEQKKEAILALYDNAVRTMWRGLGTSDKQ